MMKYSGKALRVKREIRTVRVLCKGMCELMLHTAGTWRRALFDEFSPSRRGRGLKHDFLRDPVGSEGGKQNSSSHNSTVFGFAVYQNCMDGTGSGDPLKKNTLDF